MLNEIITILSKLIAFDTTSDKSNLGLIHYVRDYLVEHGVVTYVQVQDYDSGKANLIAQIGPSTKGGILFSGHTDCVPVDGQKWATNPFELMKKNGRYFGRGSTDMKGYIACVLACVPLWQKQNLQKPIYIALTCDEETTCNGAKSVVRHLVEHNIQPDLCLIGEPTELLPAYAHKSRADVSVICRATGGHASKIHAPDITSASDLAVLFCHLLNQNKQAIGEPLSDMKATGLASFALTSWAMAPTSNVLPSDVKMHFDFRGAALVSNDMILEKLRGCAAEAVSLYAHDKTGLAVIDVDSVIDSLGFCCSDLVTLDRVKRIAQVEQAVSVSYMCEAPYFANAGFTNTIICGPGTILDAHQPNESIDEQQLVQCAALLLRTDSYTR